MWLPGKLSIKTLDVRVRIRRRGGTARWPGPKVQEIQLGRRPAHSEGASLPPAGPPGWRERAQGSRARQSTPGGRGRTELGLRAHHQVLRLGPPLGPGYGRTEPRTPPRILRTHQGISRSVLGRRHLARLHVILRSSSGGENAALGFLAQAPPLRARKAGLPRWFWLLLRGRLFPRLLPSRGGRGRPGLRGVHGAGALKSQGSLPRIPLGQR